MAKLASVQSTESFLETLPWSFIPIMDRDKGYFLSTGRLPYQQWLYNQERAKREGNYTDLQKKANYAELQCLDFTEGLRNLWEQYKRTKNQNTKWKIKAEASKMKRMKDRQCNLAVELEKKAKEAKEALLFFDPRIESYKLLRGTCIDYQPSYPHKMFTPRKTLKAKKGHFRKVLK